MCPPAPGPVPRRRLVMTTLSTPSGQGLHSEGSWAPGHATQCQKAGMPALRLPVGLSMPFRLTHCQSHSQEAKVMQM